MSLLLMLSLLVPAVAASHQPCPPEDCLVPVPAPRLPYLSGPVVPEHVDVLVTIVDGLANTRIEVQVRNPSNQSTEAVLALPLPVGAALTAFNLSVDGRLIEAVVKDRQQAMASYTQAKEQGREAALLQQADDAGMSLRINLPGAGTRVLRAAYAEWVPIASGHPVYRLPLSQLELKSGVLDVTARVQDRDGATNLRAPGLKLSFGNSVGTAHILGPAALSDLVLTWDVPATLRSTLVVAERGSDVPAVASLCLADGTVVARDVVFVLDRSGSMAGQKMVAGRETLRAALLGIRPTDRYNVITFDSAIEPLSSALVVGAHSQVEADRTKLAAIESRDATDIDGALQEALRQLVAMGNDGRLPEIVFVTDGLPSQGVTDHGRILERFVASNTRHARLHAVPIGADADAPFLADLALHSGGTLTPLDPADPDMSGRLARLYDIVGHPLLGQPVVTVTGGTLVPVPTADLLEDGCAHVALRVDATRTVEFQVTGLGSAGPTTRTLTFAPSDLHVEAAAAALWGHAKVAQLLLQGKLDGTTALLRNETTAVAIATRQLSPYTSWVIAEVPQPASQQLSEGASASASATTSSGTASLVGNGGQPAWDLQDSAANGTEAPATPGPALGLLAAALVVAGLFARRRL